MDLVAALALVAISVVALAVFGIGVIVRLSRLLFAFPGVVVHEFAHATVCRLVGVPVHEVVYFRRGDPPGYVRHGQPGRYRESFAISAAPFLFNTVLAVAAFLALVALVGATESVRTASNEAIVTGVVLAWLGLSIGSHAFPSTGDASTLWTRSRAEWRASPIVLLGVPVVAVIYVVNVLSWLYVDKLYAVGLLLLAFSAGG
ncbi:DUF3267 domain-containing protein [Natrialbaceae archaeon A-arb3/5]